MDPLIDCATLARELDGPGRGRWLVVDCRFDLADREAGARAYRAAHIPGARYMDLERTLSGTPTGGNGRHPLPDRHDFARAMAALGAGDDTRIVAYDDAGGMMAARLWWMLRWAGHREAAVLDGGLPAWREAGLPVSAELPAAAPAGGFTLREPLTATVAYETLRANLDTREYLVFDARAADRFRGENETLDPVGGHIPGARNRPFRDNLDASGRFKPAAQLRREFEALAGGVPPHRWVSQCGSGVTACHNLLALERAGLHGAALYPGSWSEWCARPGSPVVGRGKMADSS